MFSFFSLSLGKVYSKDKANYKEANRLIKNKKQDSKPSEEIKAPEKEVVTSQIAGVDIMDLEDATKVLWKHGIYAENGMGCTGPIILVNKVNKDKAKEILRAEGLLS